MTDITKDKKILLPIFPSDPIGAEFCKWFWSTSESWDGWDWICGTPPTLTAKTQWRTQKNFPIQPIELWQRFLDPNEAIGVRFKTDCKYLLLDIDKASSIHPANNPADYLMVIYTLRSIGLVGYVALRSTWSGGIHLYFPLPRAVNSFKLACRARLALEQEGFKIASGQLEIFPNTKPYAQTGVGFALFNPHRLPLQPGSGSCLLDDALQPESESVADLLIAFQTAADLQDMELLESRFQDDYDTFKKHRYSRSTDSLSQWRSYLESVKAQGWTGRGQTNIILLHLAAYARVFLQLSGEQLIDAVESMAKSAPGYEQYCNHKRDIHQRAVDVAHSAEQYYWRFGDEPNREGTYAYHFGRELGISPPQQPANNIANFKTSFQASERIKQAVATLNASSNLPDTTRARMSAIIATAKTSGRSISATTLYKPQNLPLWHPDHYQTSPEECQQELAAPPLPASDDSNSPQEDKQDLCQKEALATQQGVTVLSEPVSATPEPSPQPTAKLPQSAPEALLHPLPIYEGSFVAMAGAAPKKPAPAQNSKQQGEFEGETAPDAPAASSVPPETIRRLIKIRLMAIQKAKKAVRIQGLVEKRLLSWEERERLETTAKMQFLWESGEPILMAEVLAWARANPDALPFVLPPDESAMSSVGVADDGNGDRADINVDTESIPPESGRCIQASDHLEDVNVFSFVDRADYTIQQELSEWSRVANSNLSRAIEDNSPLRDRVQANAGMIALIQEGALLQPEDFRGVRDRVGNLQAGAIVTDIGEYIYVDFLASAPWNITGDEPRAVRRAATMLMAQIVRESIDKGYGGRVVVDAVGGTADFYQRMGFIETEAGSTITPEMALTPEAARDFLDRLTGE